jgi:predicted metal-dependent hydrolase
MISDEAHDDLSNDWRWQQAIVLFNQKEWYRAHDAFEELWHEAIDEHRALLQGIIQIAVAEHHLLNGNHRGSILLMAEGLNRLQSIVNHTLSLDLETLTGLIQLRLARLQAGQSTAGLPEPHLLCHEPRQV